MKHKNALSKFAGFSLIEIMIAMLIVTILGSIAIPGFQRMILRAKQTEAQNNLRSIYTGQKLFFLTNGSYSNDLTKIDITLPPGDQTIYNYDLTISEDEQSYTVTAEGNLDSDGALDVWTIDQDNILKQIVDDIIEE